ncbi:MAG: NTP transferase domain-containing protein, partial [Flavobacteriaceae bacterium]|nr:NTP transferase domain-containing protein [Flavobacteriaceae bacterium]
INEVNKITNHIHNLIKENIAPVKGLVLTGGKSTRMGVDKSELNYHGKPQKEFVKDLLEKQGFETFYSVRNLSTSPDTTSESENEIQDAFFNLGPFGGICSAFQKDPNSAWIVLATDLPFVNEGLIELLLSKRNPAKVATAIKGKGKQFPEPLITMYEPKAYPVLLQFLAQGYSCPRKMLINSDVEIVEVDDDLIRNVNTPEEYEAARKEFT